MAAATTNPTPPQEDHPPSSYASYVPHDLPYNPTFEDSLIATLLSVPSSDSSSTSGGIRILPDDSSEQPVQGQSVRVSDISPQSLPTIAEDELPLRLDDPRRIFASPVPGIKLTHPGGYLEGGPGLDPDMDTFLEDFVGTQRRMVAGVDELRNEVRVEVERSIDELKARVRARKKAKERNEQIEKDLKALVDQHSMEMKSLQRMAEDAERRKMVKEKRKMEDG